MSEKEIPLLTKNDVELRVQSISEKKNITLLVYKNARVDMRILDNVYGTMNWQRKHEVVNGNLFCTISVWDSANGHWVEKQDVGTESYTEAEKGQSSDSFKRAGFCWGIGRELYDAPHILFPAVADDKLSKNKSGRYSTYMKFTVKEMEYDEERHEFKTFVVMDEKGTVRFSVKNYKKQRLDGNKSSHEEVNGEEPKPPQKSKQAEKLTIGGETKPTTVKEYKSMVFGKAQVLDCMSIIPGLLKDKYGKDKFDELTIVEAKAFYEHLDDFVKEEDSKLFGDDK